MHPDGFGLDEVVPEFFSGFDNDAIDGFVGGKGAATINILALVISLFGPFTQVATRAGVGGVAAKWTMHHR